MNRSGFTLVELLAGIGIMAILLTIASLQFGTWQRKSHVERHTKELYSDLQDLRTKALFTKVRHGVEFGVKQFVFRSYSSEFDGTGTVLTTKNIPLSFTRNSSDSPADQIIFDTRGIMSDPTVQVICITTNVDAAYDAVLITPALTSMGKVTNRENACARTNVTQK